MAAIERKTGNALLDAALAYAVRGNPVFPISPGGKRPAIENPHPKDSPERATCRGECGLDGHGLYDATIDMAKIEAWWQRYPRANIGLPTGAPTKLVVVDVDGPTGEESWEACEREHGTTPTLTGLTGGDGLHVVYAHPGDVEIRNTAGKLGPGIDSRGDGGYIVAPPSIHPSGQTYEWLDPTIDPAPLPQWIRDALTATPAPVAPPARERAGDVAPGTITNYARKALDGQVVDVAGAAQGQRNHTLNQAAFRLGQLVAGGQIDELTVVDELTAAAARAGIGGTEVAATIRSGLTSGAREPQYPDPRKSSGSKASKPSAPAAPADLQEPPPVEDEPAEREEVVHPDDEPGEAPPDRPLLEGHDDEDDPDGEVNETDLGNARRLIKRHGHELRFATHLRGWLRWDGRRWTVDDDGYIDRCMHATAQSIVAEIPELFDPDQQKKRFAWSLKSEASRALEAAIRVASTLRGIPVVAQQLDADPWLLNVRNGTIDLRTGIMRAHSPADLLTKLAPVEYDPDAHDDRWDAYLESALPDAELRDWVQRAVGYTLTGDTTEEVLFFVHGPTRSGKSTFLEAVKAMLGDYARNADFETFLDRDHGGTARSDIARLAGARLVTSNEVDEGRKLAEGLVKTLTGGDTITARFLYRDEFEYLPQFKLLLAANHKPKVRHGDDAIWRRIRLLPFVHPPEHVDPELKNHLSRDPRARAAILAWAIRGCRGWQDRGLKSVTAVREATQAYRAEQDPLAEFFADNCVFELHNDQCWVTAGDLRESYEHWAKEQGTKRTISPTHLRELLEDRGCTQDRKRIDSKLTRLWRGVRMLAPNEDPPVQKLPGIDVAPSQPEEVDGNGGSPVTENEECDARDEADAGSQDSPYGRTHRGEVPETAITPSRASHEIVTRDPTLPGTFSESGLAEVESVGVSEVDPLEITYGDGFVACEGCGKPVMPATRADGRVFKTYCNDCEPF